jgi:hypothetical protein
MALGRSNGWFNPSHRFRGVKRFILNRAIRPKTDCPNFFQAGGNVEFEGEKA